MASCLAAQTAGDGSPRPTDMLFVGRLLVDIKGVAGFMSRRVTWVLIVVAVVVAFGVGITVFLSTGGPETAG